MQDTGLLIQEPPLQVLPSLADAIGLNEAIVLQQMHYWLRIRRQDGDERYHHDGRWWIYNSISDWHDQFSWWSKSTIRRTLNALVDAGVVEKRIEGENGNQQTWYTVDYQAVAELDSDPPQNDTPRPCQSDRGTPFNLTGDPCQSDHGPPNARDKTTTETSTEIVRSTSEHGRAPEKHPVVEVTSNLDPPPDQLQEGRLDPAMQFASEWKRLVGGRFEQTPDNLKAASIVCDYLPASEVRQLLGRLDDIPKRLRWEYVALELEARTRRNAMLPLEFLDLWAGRLNKRWAVDQTDRLRWVVLEHDRHEIAEALEVTRDADSPGWRYFKAVLKSDGPGGESRDGRSDAKRAMDWAKNHPDYVGDA